MDKLKMHSLNKVDENIKKIAAQFPNCITERKNQNGKVEYAIDFDMLKQEFSSVIVEGSEERYQFTWPDKKKSILLANAPIAKTLRPCREESVDFEDTENLYIEGDNLEVLKLLQETYLGKVKMIYIDPPYNTGNDFVYEDDFAQSTAEYLENSGQFDDEGNRLVKNMETNGRFHTDWLNMIYPRLKLAKDLLTDDGVIFISIDDNEVAQLRKICDEIFGVCNFVGILPTIMNLKGNNDEFGFSGTHEYTIVYVKNKSLIEDLYGIPLEDGDEKEYNLKDDKGYYKKGATLMRTGEDGAREKRPKGYYPIYVDKNLCRMSLTKINTDDIVVYPKTKNGKEMSWRRSSEKLNKTLNEFIITGTIDNISFYKKQRLEDAKLTGKKAKSLFYKPQYSSGNGTAILKKLFDERFFDNPKPVELIRDFISIGSKNNDLVLDFFSGSATTAHAVMQLNAEDGGNRKFIMVQLPEQTDEKSEAFKAGYKNICEIGKERIRRAGNKITQDNPQAKFDKGFRVLKCDSSNMQESYYNPAEYSLDLLDSLVDNIKSDRTAEDLLFQVMLDLGVLLSSKIEQTTIADKRVFNVADNFLIACFDENINDDVITAIAKQKPYYFVMRDKSIANDNVATNFEQIFNTYSPETKKKVL